MAGNANITGHRPKQERQQAPHLSQDTKWESNKITQKHHKQEPRGQPLPFR